MQMTSQDKICHPGITSVGMSVPREAWKWQTSTVHCVTGVLSLLQAGKGSKLFIPEFSLNSVLVTVQNDHNVKLQSHHV